MAKRIQAYDPFDEMKREAGSTDPNARPNRPFILDGDYPPPDAVLVSHASGSYTVTRDQHAEEQARRREVARQTDGGFTERCPPPEHPRSPEELAAEHARAEFRRAVEGGLPDAPGEAVAVEGGKPFKF